MQQTRKKMLVDAPIQKGLLVRVLIYIVFGFFFITLPMSFVRTWYEPDVMWVTHFSQVWLEHLPLLVCLVAIIPFVTYDLLRFSNRFVGPIHRIRKELKRHDSGLDPSGELKVRPDDFWEDLPESINGLIEEIHSLKKRNRELEEKHSNH